MQTLPLLPTTPRGTAVAFFEAASQRDWNKVLSLWPASSMPDVVKKAYGGLQVVSIGEPFKSGLYPGWFVPYEIHLSNGSVKEHNLAVRNDNPAKRFVLDGGF